MEFPTNPSRRQLKRQQDVAIAISGMQDIFLEPSPQRLEELLDQDLPPEEPCFNWKTFQSYLKQSDL